MKTWRIILIVIICLGFVGFLAIGYWFKTEGPVLAQIDYNTADTQIVCEEPIPVGIAIDKTVDFLDQVYQRYQGETVKDASKQMDDLMGAIAGNDGKVCDFNTECKADVGTLGPDVILRAGLLPGIPGQVDYTYAVPGCKLNPATGNPCPDLTNSALLLAKSAAALTAQADNIHALFGSKNAVVPKGLEQSGETPGETKISDADLVRRYIDNIDKFWLTPNPQGNTCALSELDRARIAQGKMGEKYPMQCLDALSKDMYTPKAWSETCQKECETFSQECKNCLAECEGDSVYATLNCKIYSMDPNDKCAPTKESFGPHQCCGQFCADGFNSQCKECLCEGLTQEQCLDWICGGSKANWVCCHEEPIQNPQYYVASQLFISGGDIETITSATGEKVYRITAGKSLTFAQAYSLFRDIHDSYTPELDVAFLLANSYKESRFIAEVGKCKVDEAKTKITDANKNALKKIIEELGLDYTKVPLSCAGSTGHGGAMGPAQFMPTTWWDITQTNIGYKFKVEEKTSEKPANPWDFRDAFLASALFLSDHGAKSGNSALEEAAEAAYYGTANTYPVWATMCYKKGFRELIDAGCLDEVGPKLEICRDSDKKLDGACSKTQYALKKAIDTIIFWK